MLQIKIIYEQSPYTFDEKVNQALEDGWTLTRRTFDAHGFLAELEKHTVTEVEQTCENCKHNSLPAGKEPCLSCRPENGVWNWEAEE